MGANVRSVHSEVLVPVLQAVITALVGSAAILSGWALYQERSIWSIALTSWAAIMLLAWLRLLARLQARQDAIAGVQPPPAPVVQYASELRLSIDWDQGRAGLFDDLRITDDQFITWACSVARGTSLGENWHTGRQGEFSKGQYHKFLERLDNPHGLIRKKGHADNSGYELTSKGRAVADAILKRYGKASPHPAPRVYRPGPEFRD